MNTVGSCRYMDHYHCPWCWSHVLTVSLECTTPYWFAVPNKGDPWRRKRLWFLTFQDVVQASHLLRPIQGVDAADPLRQVKVVCERAGKLCQKPIEGAAAVPGHGEHEPLKTPVPIPVEAHFPCTFLWGKCLKRACAVEANIGAVRRARNHTAGSRASLWT